MDNFKKFGAAAVFLLIVKIYFIVAFIVNISKLVNCDFEEPWKDEIIHGIGLVIPPAAAVTVWM